MHAWRRPCQMTGGRRHGVPGRSRASTSSWWRWPSVSYPTTVTHGVGAGTTRPQAGDAPAAARITDASTTTAEPASRRRWNGPAGELAVDGVDRRDVDGD